MTDNESGNKLNQLTTHPVSPNSKKVYVAGSLHKDIRVPFREITLTGQTPHSENGGNGNGDKSHEPKETILVYDTSGPYTDPNVEINPYRGLKPIRAKWISDRNDVEAYEGRAIVPIDNGYKRENQSEGVRRFDLGDRKVLRAKPGA